MNEGMERVLASIEAKDPSLVMTGKQANASKLNRISTGILSLDRLTGGGLPRGLITHLYGDFGASKSSTAIQIAASLMKADKKACVVILDLEEYWLNSTEFISQFDGIDLERIVLLYNKAHPEKSLDACIEILASGACDLLIVDSIAAYMPTVEIDKTFERVSQTGYHSKAVKRLLQKMTAVTAPTLNRNRQVVMNRCAMLLLNQTYTHFKEYGAIIVPTAERPLNFFSSIQIRMSAPKAEYLYYPEEARKIEAMGNTVEALEAAEKSAIGKTIKYTVVKNRTAATETQEGSVHFYNRHVPFPTRTGFTGFGFDNVYELFELADRYSLFKRSGTWFIFSDTHKEQGLDKALSVFRNNRSFISKIKKEIQLIESKEDPVEKLIESELRLNDESKEDKEPKEEQLKTGKRGSKKAKT